MRKMNAVTIDPEKRTVVAGGGCIWAEIDAAAAVAKLSLVGGTVNQTGVAGYTTGGGFGWLTGQHGLAVDNMLAAEVVTADGVIRTCSETEEADLFWALRGAGHMFGVVTSFTFQAHPQPEKVFGGMVIFPPTPECVKHLVKFATGLQDTSDGRSGMFCGFATPPGMGKRVIFGACFHDGPEDEGRKIFAPFVGDAPEPPLRMNLSMITFLAMNEVLAMAAASEGRRVSKGACYEGPLPPEAFQKVLDMYEDFIANVCPEAGEAGSCLFEFYPLSKVMSVPSAATAFVTRGRHSNTMMIPRWRSEKYDTACRQFAQDSMEALKQIVRDRGGATGEYINYDGIGTPAEKTYGDNFPRLAAIKARYDPDNVFTKRQGLRAPDKNQPAEKEAVVADPHEHVDSEGDSSVTEESTGPTTPVSTVAEPVTHEIRISAKGGVDERTEEILKEVRSATAKLAGVNAVVTVTPVAEGMLVE